MANGHPVSIGDELKTFFEGPVSVLVGTREPTTQELKAALADFP